MNGPEDDTEKSYEASAQKLKKAREKGEVVRSTDLLTASSYLGFLLACVVAGRWSMETVGTLLKLPLDRADGLSADFFRGNALRLTGDMMRILGTGLAPFFLFPAGVVLLAVFAQRSFVFTPARLAPRLSRLSVISNATQKFGRNGLFEFGKSTAKLTIYAVILAIFVLRNMPDIVGILHASPGLATGYMAHLCLQFIMIIFLVSVVIGCIDWFWQNSEHLRKNRMSRKELTDQTKEAEGDPQLKQVRRQRAHAIATNRMMADVPTADVVIVNPTHFAVALAWSRLPGSAPACVAKGAGEVAARIRHLAEESKVPVHSDPPTARALYASVEIGAEISEAHYRPVALAIRFAEKMRHRARGQML